MDGFNPLLGLDEFCLSGTDDGIQATSRSPCDLTLDSNHDSIYIGPRLLEIKEGKKPERYIVCLSTTVYSFIQSD